MKTHTHTLKISLLVLFMVFSVALSAADEPNQCSGAKVLKNIVYAKVDDTQLLLDLYLPANMEKPVPLIVCIHGGG